MNTLLKGILCFFLFSFFFSYPEHADASMYLKDKLQKAEVGDYIIAALDNTYTAIIIKDKSSQYISIEEITVPAARLRQYNERQQWKGWKTWIQSNAPGNTSWIVYTIHKASGKISDYYSYTQNSWCDVTQMDHFMSKLLNLRLEPMKQESMKKTGPAPSTGSLDQRRTWAPKMIFEGNVIKDVVFQGWCTCWPRDNSELAGKIIFVYVPADDSKYPSYFPYWLEIRGITGKAKIRIIDSGKNVSTSRPLPPSTATSS